MILDEICQHKRDEVEARKAALPVKSLHERIHDLPALRDFRTALRDSSGISLIAEVKRASPSKGDLLEDADAVDLAATYEQAGARAVSILTDQRYFKGSLDDFVAVRQNIPLPCLRKEFIIDEYQIYESRVANADALLLIVRLLSDQQLKEYLSLVRELGMAALVETHNKEEIERALEAGAHIVGINNRDLSTFEVDLSLTLELRKHVPGGHVLVSESGIETRDHVRMLEDGGVDAILVGETLVRSKNVVAKVHELLAIEKR